MKPIPGEQYEVFGHPLYKEGGFIGIFRVLAVLSPWEQEDGTHDCYNCETSNGTYIINSNHIVIKKNIVLIDDHGNKY